MTVGVTIIGVAGTLGFSVVAALSNPGKTVATTTGTTGTAGTTSASSSKSDATTSGSNGITVIPFQSNLGLGSSQTGGRSNAVTGGS